MILRTAGRPFAATVHLQSVRALRTASTNPRDDTLLDALDAIGSMLPNTSRRTPVSSTTPPPPSPPSSTHSPLDAAAPTKPIPPAEDPLLHYLTSLLQKHGHRARAARTTSRTLLHLHAFTRCSPLPLLREAVTAASPAVRTMTHRQGAKNIVRPVALGEKQRVRCALTWMLAASERRPGQTVSERLAREVVAVLEGTSEALKKKEEVHRFAMVNRGNAQWRV